MQPSSDFLKTIHAFLFSIASLRYIVSLWVVSILWFYHRLPIKVSKICHQVKLKLGVIFFTISCLSSGDFQFFLLLYLKYLSSRNAHIRHPIFFSWRLWLWQTLFIMVRIKVGIRFFLLCPPATNCYLESTVYYLKKLKSCCVFVCNGTTLGPRIQMFFPPQNFQMFSNPEHFSHLCSLIDGHKKVVRLILWFDNLRQGNIKIIKMWNGFYTFCEVKFVCVNTSFRI